MKIIVYLKESLMVSGWVKQWSNYVQGKTIHNSNQA